MASTPRPIGPKGRRRWRVEVCVARHREGKTFDTRAEAQAWAVEREAELRRSGAIVGGKTVADACRRFRAELTPTRAESHRTRQNEANRLERFARSAIGRVPLAALTLEHAERHIASELARGIAPDTVTRELAQLKVVIRQAVRWRYLPAYPWTGLRMPPASRPRERLPTATEIALIRQVSGLEAAEEAGRRCRTNTEAIACAFEFACETAMRLGEICALTADDVDLEARVAHIRRSKTGHPRSVPLSTRAVALLEMAGPRGRRWFGVSSDSGSTLFRKITARAGLADLHFHDSRAEGTTRLSKRLDIYQLSRVTGHRDLRILASTYYRESAEAMVRLLD